VAGLAPTFGRGAMTNSWVDIKNANVILVMGGNPAEAHPCGFKWAIEAKVKNKARLIVVDPRFTRTAAVADVYTQIRPGSDIAFLGGVINYLLSNDKILHEYVRNYTNASFLVREDFQFDEGLFSGYIAEKRSYDKSTWAYDLDKDGYAKVDATMQNPSCVLQLMKKHYAAYTPEAVSSMTGVSQGQFLKICELMASTAAPNRTLTSLYALGWTQHTVGSQNIRAMACIQLLLGNIGMPGGGVNALRGHSNIQGLTDLGVMSHLLPGYLGCPVEAEPDLKTYLEKRTPKSLRPGQMNFWQNYPKFIVSLLKAWYGPAATIENDFAYEYLPKNDKVYDILQVFQLMSQGKVNGYICQGFNPLASIPDKGKLTAAFSKLKFLVIIDPLTTETSSFWQNHGEFNDVDPAIIQTEVFRLPSTCFAEEEGSLVNSSRWLQWHYKGAEPPGDARGDVEIMGDLFLRIRQLYASEGGAFPDPILKLHWPYKIARIPSAEELAKEYNGYALADIPDPKEQGKFLVRKGDQVPGFAVLQADGTTASGCWIFAGSWTQAGNQMARRDPADPYGLGATPGWAWSWPANRRILYNRASADVSGRPWDPNRKYIFWNGEKWAGADIPDYKPDVSPEDGMGPFIMNAEGVGKLFALAGMVEGPFPTHYEPFETPLDKNRFSLKSVSNPATRIFKEDRDRLGTAKEFPFVATTYRLTEHFHYWTKNARIPAILQPQAFVEIGEALAQLRGIRNGEMVFVRSRRGQIKLSALVTKRIRPLRIEGNEVHVVGLPIHWGFEGLTKPGHLVNTLTPFVGDANVQTPEFKAFLVDIQKA
jgi:formate dehydrogenase major subunit